MRARIKSINDSSDFCKWNVELLIVASDDELQELKDKQKNKFVEVELKCTID